MGKVSRATPRSVARTLLTDLALDLAAAQHDHDAHHITGSYMICDGGYSMLGA